MLNNEESSTDATRLIARQIQPVMPAPNEIIGAERQEKPLCHGYERSEMIQLVKERPRNPKNTKTNNLKAWSKQHKPT
ncbi:unnamed protein product [Fusarium graminearum]|nr:unnamed protein product [Fusarium graminearum]VTO85941.1 unnamed protein product [Fusarium graminearum]